MSDPQEVRHLRIPSRLDQLEQVDEAVERMARAMGFDDGACADLGICATEAVSNAIIHAHGQRPDLFVDVSLERFPGFLRILVRDRGRGFDFQSVPDPTLPENLLKVSGRGLHLIRALMDEVEVQRFADGLLVVMTKRLTPP